MMILDRVLREKAEQKIANLIREIKTLQEGKSVTTGSWLATLNSDIERAETDLKLLREFTSGQLPMEKEVVIRKALPEMRNSIEHLNSIMLANQTTLAGIERVKRLLA